jgi:hypothetical protein
VSDKDVSCIKTFEGILTMLSINIKLDELDLKKLYFCSVAIIFDNFEARWHV